MRRPGDLVVLTGNRSCVRTFEAALVDRVADVALRRWDWSQQHEYLRAFDSVAKDGAPARLRIYLLEEARIQRGRGKTKVPALSTLFEVRTTLALDNLTDFSSRIEQLHDTVHVWAGPRSTMRGRSALTPL